MLKPVPTLSRMGWVTDIHPKVDFLLAHWVRSDKRQNPLLPQHTHNLQWILHKKSGDPRGICQDIMADLSTYFGKYFEDVVVDASAVNDNDDGSSINFHIKFSISFTHEGARHSASRVIETDGKNFKRFITDNNVDIEAPGI